MSDTNILQTIITAEENNEPLDRRRFLHTTGAGLAAATVLGSLAPGAVRAQNGKGSSAPQKISPADAAKKSAVSLPPLDHPSEGPKGKLPAPAPKSTRVGFAVVGLGQLSLEAIMPAFGESRYAKPVALVSGDKEKAAKVARQYGVREDNIYSYDNYDTLKDNPEVEAVYIVLPNSMHEEYTIRAAQAGKHVLCEKPMANTSAGAQRMIDACKKAGKRLMIAYRIQYEPHHRLIQQWLREEKWGKVKLLDMVNAQNIGDPDQFRLKKALAGGGALPDIGIYCLNTARFLTGEEPQMVSGHVYSTPGDPRFREVEEAVLFQLHFPSGILANCATHYGVHQSRRYRCYADKGGTFGMDPAFSYTGLQMEVSYVENKMEMKAHPTLEQKNQFATELDHFALCIRENRQPYTPGEEGLQDMRIMEAIYRSAREARPVKLDAVSKKDAFRGWKGPSE